MAIRKIGASVTLNASQFKKEMTQVNSNLAGLKSEMKAVTAEFAENADSVEALTAKQKNLQQQEDQQREKIRALTKAYAELGGEQAKDTVLADQIRKQLNTAQAELVKTEQAVKANSDALKEARSVSGRFSAALEDIKNKAEPLGDSLKKLEPAAKLAGNALAAAGKAATAFVAAGAAATGAAATLAVSGLKTLAGWAQEAAQQVDENGNVIDSRFSTLAGNLTSLNAATAAAKAGIATALLPALESLSGEGAQLLQGFSADLAAAEGDTEKMGKVVAEYIKKAVALIRQQAPELLKLGGDLLRGLLEGIDGELPEILDMGGEILETLLSGIEQNADGLGDAAVEIVMALLGFLVEQSHELLEAGVQMLTSVISGISENLPQLIPAAIDAVVQLLGALVSNAPLLISAGLELILAIVTGLVDGIPDLIKAVPELIQSFKDAWTEKADSIKDIGQQIVDKIKEGLVAAWEGVKQWFSNAISGLRANVSVTGEKAASGLNYVPFDNFPAILHRGERVLTAKENASGAYGGGGGARVVNLTVNTQQLSEAQVDYLIRRVNTSLGEEL